MAIPGILLGSPSSLPLSGISFPSFFPPCLSNLTSLALLPVSGNPRWGLLYNVPHSTPHSALISQRGLLSSIPMAST